MTNKRATIGEVIGRLTLVEELPKAKGKRWWKCLCSCGNEAVISRSALVKRNPTSSCGCLAREASFGATLKDLTGQKIGLWTVKELGLRKKKPNGGAYWKCICECGIEREVSADILLKGQSQSCGCARSRPICPKGHDTLVWGRTKPGKSGRSGGWCKACLKNRNLMRNYGITL